MIDTGRKPSVVGQIFIGAVSVAGLFLLSMLIGSLSAPMSLSLAQTRGLLFFSGLSLLVVIIKRKKLLFCSVYAFFAVISVAFWFFVQGFAGG